MTYTVCIVQTLPCLHLWSEKQTSTTLHCSKLTFESSVVNSLNKKTYYESDAPDCPCDGWIKPLYRNSLCAGQHCWLLSQVQETILHKTRCTQSNIWVELFWNSVVNKMNHWFLVVFSFGSPNKVVSLTQQNSVSEFWSRMIEFIPIIFIYNL